MKYTTVSILVALLAFYLKAKAGTGYYDSRGRLLYYNPLPVGVEIIVLGGNATPLPTPVPTPYPRPLYEHPSSGHTYYGLGITR